MAISATTTSQRPASRQRMPKFLLVVLMGLVPLLAIILVAVALWPASEGRDTLPVKTMVVPPQPVKAVPPLPDDPPQPPPPPRALTVNDKVRAHFKGVGGRLCVAGNLARFGPFAGTVHLTNHPDGRTSHLKVEMQPSSARVISCMKQKFRQGHVFSGDPLGVIYHFSGGRNPDGLQYREGIELKLSTP